MGKTQKQMKNYLPAILYRIFIVLLPVFIDLSRYAILNSISIAFFCAALPKASSKRMDNQTDKRHKKRMKIREKNKNGQQVLTEEKKIFAHQTDLDICIILTNMSLQIMSYGWGLWLGLAVIFLQLFFFSFPLSIQYASFRSPPVRCIFVLFSTILSLNLQIDRFIPFNLYRYIRAIYKPIYMLW